MLRGLWLAAAVGLVACVRPAPEAPVTETANNEPEAVPVPQERDPQREATDKVIAEIRSKQIADKKRFDDAKAQDEQEAQRSEDDWLKAARDACYPSHCDGSPVRPMCPGVYDIPKWARVQAATEACANPPPTVHGKESTQVLSAEDWAAWRKRVSGK